jgi:hypothetical protein
MSVPLKKIIIIYVCLRAFKLHGSSDVIHVCLKMMHHRYLYDFVEVYIILGNIKDNRAMQIAPSLG